MRTGARRGRTEEEAGGGGQEGPGGGAGGDEGAHPEALGHRRPGHPPPHAAVQPWGRGGRAVHAGTGGRGSAVNVPMGWMIEGLKKI